MGQFSTKTVNPFQHSEEVTEKLVAEFESLE
jgi:hypothetical protein